MRRNRKRYIDAVKPNGDKIVMRPNRKRGRLLAARTKDFESMPTGDKYKGYHKPGSNNP